MKLSGSHKIDAPKQAVWDRLLDPDSLSGCLPGVEKLEKIGENEYDMAINVGIGPIKGSYDGRVHITDVNEPESYSMLVEGSGRMGFVKGNGKINLAESGDGGTDIQYEGDVEVGGAVGGVAQRMMGSVSQRMADQFFGCIEQKIKDAN